MRRSPKASGSAHASVPVITALLLALSVVAVLFGIHIRARGKRDSSARTEDSSEPEKFETTLGEFHDMREALRPLQHTRIASRRDPAKPIP